MPEREEFYSNLNMEDITDADYMQVKGVYISKSMHYFWLMFLKTVEKCASKYFYLAPAKFLSASGLAWQGTL